MRYLNTSSVTDMSQMFYDCQSLTSLNLSPWNVSNVTNMSYMFSGCSGLTSLNVSGWDVTKVTSMSGMLSGCSGLTSLNGLSGWDVSNVNYMNGMFTNCSSLTTFYVSGWNVSNVISMSGIFYGCSGLTSLNVSNWNTANATSMSGMFYGCSGLTSLNVSGWNTAKVTVMDNMFSGCSGLASLNVSNWNTANVTSMSGMFNGCSGLASLNLSNWNTANVTNMSKMFNGCSGLTSIGSLSNWNTANVTNMSNMFYNCSAITSLDVSNWNTANVTNMSNMFYGCSGPTSLNLSGWDTANVTNMSNMFYGCNGLTSLNVSGWDTANVTNMSNLFNGCNGLTSLNVSNWNTANVTNMSEMFKDCSNLTTITVGTGWTPAESNSSDMFSGCSSLVGGNGTRYDSSHTDGEYARVDLLPFYPGYLTGTSAGVEVVVTVKLEASAPQNHFITNNFWVKPNHGESGNLYANQSASCTVSNGRFFFEMESQEDPTWGITWSPKAVYVNGKDKTEDIEHGGTTYFDLENITGDTEIRVVFDPDCYFARVTNISAAGTRSLYWDNPQNITHEIAPQSYAYVPIKKTGTGQLIYGLEDLDDYEPKGYWYNGLDYMGNHETSDGGMWYQEELFQGDDYCFYFELQPTAELQDRTILFGLKDGIPTSDKLTIMGTHGDGGTVQLCYTLNGNEVITPFSTPIGGGNWVVDLTKSQLGNDFKLKFIPDKGRELYSLYLNDVYRNPKSPTSTSGDTLIFNLDNLAAKYDVYRIAAVYKDLYDFTKRKVTFTCDDADVMVFTTGRKTPFWPPMVTGGYYQHTYNVGDTYQSRFISDKAPVKVTINGEDVTSALTVEEGTTYILPERTLTSFDEAVDIRFERGEMYQTKWTVLQTGVLDGAEMVVTANGVDETISCAGASTTQVFGDDVTKVRLVVPVANNQPYQVKLEDCGSQKLAVVKLIKETQGLGLKEAKDLADNAPIMLTGYGNKDDALSYVSRLKALGATAEAIAVKVYCDGVDVTSELTTSDNMTYIERTSERLVTTNWIINSEILVNRFDTNEDGTINISDVTKLVNKILGKE